MAFNKVQQRFDKSIREAVVATERARDSAGKEALRIRQERARLEIPLIEKMIDEGKTGKGIPLSKADIKELRTMLKHRHLLISVEDLQR